MKYKQLLKQEKTFVLIFALCFLSILRNLLIPLQGDELTYDKIANNILMGKYFQTQYPTTIAPMIPFIMAFFKITAMPMLSIVLNKAFFILLTLFGFRFVYLFLKKQQIDQRIILAILALTAANPIGISYFGSLFPEAMGFFCFWGFLYYSVQKISTGNFLKMLFLFLMLSMTRYLYLVLGLIVLYNFYNFYKTNTEAKFYKLILYIIAFSLPILLWMKFIYNVEHNNLSEISYFNRFKTDNQFVYNVKAGLGIIKHHEVDRINGIPAFVSLFTPVTGFRNYIISVLLIVAFAYGYYKKSTSLGLKILVTSIALVMLGFIVAGTGFSRYWLILLPGYFLGYYFLATKFNIKEKWIVLAAQVICFIYIANELRLDVVILNRHL